MEEVPVVESEAIVDVKSGLTTLDAAERAPQSAKGFGVKARAR